MRTFWLHIAFYNLVFIYILQMFIYIYFKLNEIEIPECCTYSICGVRLRKDAHFVFVNVVTQGPMFPRSHTVSDELKPGKTKM